MKEKIKSISIIAVATVLLVAGLSYAQTWTAPTQDPPGGNVEAPINVSSVGQTKTGALTIGGLFTTNDVIQANGGILVNGQFSYPSSAVDGRVLRSDGVGYGIWQPTIETRTSDPTAPEAGRMWLRTDL